MGVPSIRRISMRSSMTTAIRPRTSSIEQIAKIVGVSPDVLYFHANRQPPDVKTEADQERLEAAYRAFRKALGVKPTGQAKMKLLRDPLGRPIDSALLQDRRT